MSDPKEKDGESFFRKVVRFVANPATDWTELNSRQDAVESEYAKSELKAMIERKRRNDFVRKREFDMLRKVRREGLSGDGLAALAGASNLDDSEPRAQETARQDMAVKAKIDEIEQQMVGESFSTRGSLARPSSFYNAPTQPAAIGDAATEPMHLPGGARQAPPPAAAPAAATMGAGMSPPVSAAPLAADFSNPFAIEVNEIAHDPDLDEAVIAFANADFELCEQSLSSLVAPGGNRNQHAETWLVLFDLYRSIGQQHKFESLALDYAQQFGWSAPQWFSLPKLVAEAAAEEKPRSGGATARVEGSIGWMAPDVVDMDAVARLRSQTLQMPLPWVLDWNAVRSVDPEACHQLSLLFRGWAGQQIEMRWLGGERLLDVLADAAPTGVRDADPVYWLLRLDALRLANRPDQFDEVAIDYCVTYEVSPPSWEPARCSVRVSEGGGSTVAPMSSLVSDVSTGFVESSQILDEGVVQMATVELSGQLVGDIGKTLEKLQGQLGNASIVNVTCSKLIRVDFIAAGDLLNWVLARRGENRNVSFEESHRLVALFFGAMGINEHARVKVRNI